MDARADYLLRRLAALRSPPRTENDPWIDQDLHDVVIEAADYLRDALGLAELDKELAARANVDTAGIRLAVDSLREAARTSPPPAFPPPPAKPLDWGERLSSLEGLVQGLTNSAALKELEVLLRLGLVGDIALDTALVAISPSDASLRAIRDEVRKKLDIAPDKVAMDLWARLNWKGTGFHSDSCPWNGGT